MAQEKKNEEIRQQTPVGVVKIADDVVTLIVAYAVLDVDGVSCIAGGVTRDSLSKGGIRKLGKNVRVDVSKEGVRAEVSLIMEYGFNIPETSSKVQKRIKTAVETMTGLTVLDAGIRVVGISMGGEEE